MPWPIRRISAIRPRRCLAITCAAAGLPPVAAIFATVSVGPVSGVVLGGFAAIFGAFAIRTGLRHGTSLEVSDSELRAVGLRHVVIRWDELDRMKVAFYSTRRDRKSGWMQLELAASRARLSLDSRLDGFDRLVRYAAEIAARRGLALSDATVANLQALGVRVAGALMTDLLQVRDPSVRFATPGGHIDAVKKRLCSACAWARRWRWSASSARASRRSAVAILRRPSTPRNGEIAGGQIVRLHDPPNGIGSVDLANAASRRAGDARAARRQHLDRLPGAHELAVAAAHGRQPGRRGSQPAPAMRRPRGAGARHRDVAATAGFPDPVRAWRSYPFELSGGLRQRAMIAMALVCRPALLILDEPTTALDVTIQAQILKLVVELQRELGMAVLLITHDLGVVANIAEEIVVMYHGEACESGTLEDIFQPRRASYLQALLWPCRAST